MNRVSRAWLHQITTHFHSRFSFFYYTPSSPSSPATNLNPFSFISEYKNQVHGQSKPAFHSSRFVSMHCCFFSAFHLFLFRFSMLRDSLLMSSFILSSNQNDHVIASNLVLNVLFIPKDISMVHPLLLPTARSRSVPIHRTSFPVFLQLCFAMFHAAVALHSLSLNPAEENNKKYRKEILRKVNSFYFRARWWKPAGKFCFSFFSFYFSDLFMLMNERERKLVLIT